LANQNIGLERHEFGRQPRHARDVAVGVAHLEMEILALAPSTRMQINEY
jgi:hypothetical protein